MTSDEQYNPAMDADINPHPRYSREYFAWFGARGGAVKTPKKARAARRNWKRALAAMPGARRSAT